MKKITVILIGLLASSLCLELYAQSVSSALDPMRLRNTIEIGMNVMRQDNAHPMPDSLKHSILKRQKRPCGLPAASMEDVIAVEKESSDTLMSAQYIRAYVQQRASSIDEQIFLDSTVTYINDNIPESKTVYSYDANGKQVCKIVYKCDGYSWKPYLKVENAYDENGRRLQDATWSWDDEASWIGSYKYEYDYDENGNRILDAYYSGWDSDIDDWRGSRIEQYKYDELGNRIMYAYLSGWNNTTHTFSSGSKTEYIYNANNKQIGKSYYSWYSEKKDFVPQNKHELDYDKNGNIILEAEYNYDEQTGSWIGAYKYEYAYKGYNKELQTLQAYYNDWNPETSSWVGNEKHEYDYDSYGNRILESYSQWSNESNGWIETRRKEYAFEGYNSRQTKYAYYVLDKDVERLVGLEHWTAIYNNYGDITQHIKYVWNAEVNGWDILDKYDYEFSYNEYGHAISSTTKYNELPIAKTEYEYETGYNGNLLNSISYLWVDDNWVASTKLERKYNDSGRVSSELTFLVSESGILINVTKKEWEYSENMPYYSDASKYESYRWSVNDDAWYGVEKYEYVYDSNGRELSYMRYNDWIPELGWIGDRGYESVYDENGRRTTYTEYQNWNKENNFWRYGTKETKEYDSYGQTLLQLTATWNSNDSVWQETSKIVNEYTERKSGNYTYYDQTNHEEWDYDRNRDKWIGSYKYEYAYNEKGRKILNARYNGWDYDGDCWRGNYKYEYAYDDNNNQTLDAYYNGWDNVNHCWRGSYKFEYAYIYVNDTIYYNDQDYYVNQRSYTSYTAKYYMDGAFWYGESKTEYLYDDMMRKAAETYYRGMKSETEWLCEGKREYEYDVYGNVCKDDYSLYNDQEDSWTKENTTLYYYTKGINVLDESEWLILKDVYTDLSRRKGWKRQWYDCKNINSVYSWSGVTRSDGHVTSVDISGFKLYGSFPYQLFTLPYLKEINISNNNFAGDLTTEFADSLNAIHVNAENITSLYMANNNFEGNAAGFVEHLPSLTTLNMSGNKFNEVNPMLPTSITSLNIGKQKIDKVINLNLSSDVVSEIQTELPNIWLYDHENQSFATWQDMILTEGPTNSFSWYSNYFSMLISQEDGAITLPQVSDYKKQYRGESGDTLNVISNGGSAIGSTMKVKLNFELGDANFVNGVDATDLQATILYAFGNYNSRPFNFTAADTYRDQNINVQDVVCTVNILLDKTPALAPQDVMRKTRSRNGNDVTEEACVYVENGQVLLYTTRPVAVLDVMTSNPVKWNVGQYGLQQSSTNSHLVGYSLSGACLPVGTTVLGTVEGDTHIVCVSLSDENARPITVTTNKDTVTGIDSVSTETDSSELIYDLMGRRTNTIGNGINIIKNANGVKKVINRNK